VERRRIGSVDGHVDGGAECVALGCSGSLIALILVVKGVEWDVKEQYTLQKKTWEKRFIADCKIPAKTCESSTLTVAKVSRPLTCQLNGNIVKERAKLCRIRITVRLFDGDIGAASSSTGRGWRCSHCGGVRPTGSM
jgi:hypothetical protein